MHEVGMYGGSFNPLHLGHVNDIIHYRKYLKSAVPFSPQDLPPMHCPS